MITTTPGPRGSTPRTRRLLPLAAVAVAVTMALLGGTMATWVSRTTARGGEVTAGDLELRLDGATWRQVTPGVTEPRSGEFDGTAPGDFFTMPGDVIEVLQPVTTVLRGDNLAGGMRVRFADPDALHPDVEEGRIAVGFAVLDADGAQVAPATGAAELGTTVVVPGLTGSDSGAVSDWTVAIRVEVLGEPVWTDGEPADATSLWVAGDVLVDLRQVRAGEDAGGAA